MVIIIWLSASIEQEKTSDLFSSLVIQMSNLRTRCDQHQRARVAIRLFDDREEKGCLLKLWLFAFSFSQRIDLNDQTKWHWNISMIHVPSFSIETAGAMCQAERQSNKMETERKEEYVNPFYIGLRRIFQFQYQFRHVRSQNFLHCTLRFISLDYYLTGFNFDTINSICFE